MKRIGLLLAFVAGWSLHGAAQQPAADPIAKKCSPLLLQQLQRNSTGGAARHTQYKLVCTNTQDIWEAHLRAKVEPKLWQHLPQHRVLMLQITDTALLRRILQLPCVQFADLYHAPTEELELSNYDPTLNNISLLQKKYPLANGNGLTVSIKENIFDTADIDFKGRYRASALASPIFSTHASIMATLVAGGGNTAPNSLGVAPGARLVASNFTNLFPDRDSALQAANISVQNHAYGTVVENFYGPEARAYDQQLQAVPTLAHVFSVGNSGALTPTAGLYAGLPGVANSTGNFKMAKNALSVAAADSFGLVPAAISKGPAYDGRLKPELAAFGEDGSSGAAAVVSGTLISLQHLYQQRYSTMPAFALLKAVLFNSATDIGPAGIDFASGFGLLNAAKAADNIANGRFFAGSATQGVEQTFSVTVPTGIKQAKFTLVWTDPAAALLAPKALVNNIDLSLERVADGTKYLPQVLNHYPHPDSLRQLPKTHRDTLNNAEQITVTNPQPGQYTIRVLGASIVQAPQPYFVAYQYDTANQFEFTHPIAGSQFKASKPNIIRWQQTLGGTGSLQYSFNNQDWRTINPSVALDAGYALWQTPDTIATAQLRIVSNSAHVSASFVISTPPILQIGYDCAQDALLWWHKIANASRYRLYRLGQQYLEPIAETTDTFFAVNKATQTSLHFVVEPILPNGSAAQRSMAYNYTTQAAGCFVQQLLAELLGDKAEIQLQLGSTLGLQGFTLEKQVGNGYRPLAQVQNPIQLRYTFFDSSLSSGLNTYRIKLLRQNGNAVLSNTATVYFFGNQRYLVYPNPLPLNGRITLVAENLANASFRLYNALGQLVLQRSTRRFYEQISTTGLASGLYIYTIAEGQNIVQTGKLVVQ